MALSNYVQRSGSSVALVRQGAPLGDGIPKLVPTAPDGHVEVEPEGVVACASRTRRAAAKRSREATGSRHTPPAKREGGGGGGGRGSDFSFG